jgi:hypothetical protein
MVLADASGVKGGAAMRVGRGWTALVPVLATLGLVAPEAASAQGAWLPAKGQAFLTLGYQFYSSEDRQSSSDGERYYDGLIHQHGLVGNLTYGITDRVAVSVGVPPYFMSSYNGPDPHTWPVFDGDGIARDPGGQGMFEPPTLDDGSYHGSFQDLRGELSFMAVEGPWVVTPFVGFHVPIQSYDYHAQTAVGRRLWDLRIGANVGGFLGSLLPDAYVHGRYAFAYRQAELGLRFNYSYVDAEVGYFVTPSLALRVIGASQIAHDGLRDEEFPFDSLPPPQEYSISQWLYLSSEDAQMRGQSALPVALHHDQLQLQSNIDLGVGASVSVTPSLSLSGQVYRTVWGRGGRATGLAVSFWATVGFSPSELFGKSEPRAAVGPGPSLRPPRGRP